jgi:catalase
MSKGKATSNSEKRKQERGAAPYGESQLAAGGELHQIAGGEHPALTTNQGVALADNQNSLRASPLGPTLLEDFILREKITHFDHERIPERIVHARATGVHGFFELTASLKQYTTARILTEIGEKTPLFARISTVAGGAGSVDTPRDVLGSGRQQRSGFLHPGRHQIPRSDPCGKDGTRPRLSAIGDRA